MRSILRSKSNSKLLPLLATVISIIILAAYCITAASVLRLRCMCNSIKPDIIYSDLMRDVHIDDAESEALYYFEENGMSAGIIGINKSVLKKVVCNNLFKNFKDEYVSNTAPYIFYHLIDNEAYESCVKVYESIMCDVRYFPVAHDPTGNVDTPYDDSWGSERSYGGKRRHEGCDIMAGNNMRDYFPIISVCDGVVEHMGWLELGGYRIGIRSEHGAYYYYAHLAAYPEGLAEGDRVSAGDVIGTMGDTGYSEVEGTTGLFDVHLHFGIYVDSDESEVSYNPYGILKAAGRSRRSFIDNTE